MVVLVVSSIDVGNGDDEPFNLGNENKLCKKLSSFCVVDVVVEGKEGKEDVVDLLYAAEEGRRGGSCRGRGRVAAVSGPSTRAQPSREGVVLG